jgi:hypothetical protein
MPTLNLDTVKPSNPVDVIENLATLNDWTFDRADEDQITLCVESDTSSYHVAITWMDEVESLHINSAFDVKVPEHRVNEMLRLVNRVNEQMFVGHFDYWSEEDVVLYRHSLLLPDGLAPTEKQCELLVSTALSACEQYITAFQYVVSGGKTAREALELIMFETIGEA